MQCVKKLQGSKGYGTALGKKNNCATIVVVLLIHIQAFFLKRGPGNKMLKTKVKITLPKCWNKLSSTVCCSLLMGRAGKMLGKW